MGFQSTFACNRQISQWLPKYDEYEYGESRGHVAPSLAESSQCSVRRARGFVRTGLSECGSPRQMTRVLIYAKGILSARTEPEANPIDFPQGNDRQGVGSRK